ncbi:helix-turn-helix domain-containing protein [Enterobacter wuhouensis]|uniref:winged helix-turn-helix transcriptional regulator n=1 Tax=Enterobacter wuhouensis TaxID=2529381 RepID=UPI002FDE1A18
MSLGSRKEEYCPVARSVDLIGDRWSLLIVRNAFDGMTRFGDFQRSLGVARNILSDRLRKLVEADILTLQGASDGTAYQEYVLTEKGESLFPVVVALRQWGEQHLFEQGERHSLLVDKRTGKPVRFMTPAAHDGTALLAGDTEVQKVDELSERPPPAQSSGR